ncbi:MAG: hypothetical protein ACK4M9_06615 [Anaerobacillus sp.]|uniref:hypothetical protein n=1 Tax=Anaerobacillus sp. TaxID=1872506 RepID=UPI00391CAFB6
MMKGDYGVWLRITLTYFVILTILYIPIMVFNIYPSNYTLQDSDNTVIIEYGVFKKGQYILQKNEENQQQLAVLNYHIRSLHSLLILGIPLLSFISVGFLFQFSTYFKKMKGIETSKKRAVALILMTTVILLWLIGEFLYRRSNIISSLYELL